MKKYTVEYKAPACTIIYCGAVGISERDAVKRVLLAMEGDGVRFCGKTTDGLYVCQDRRGRVFNVSAYRTA